MITTEYIIVDENPEEEVKKCNTDNEEGLTEYFDFAHYTILKLTNEKIEYPHYTCNGVEWRTPKEIKEILFKIIRKCDFDDEKSCHLELCYVMCSINPNYKHKKEKQ